MFFNELLTYIKGFLWLRLSCVNVLVSVLFFIFVVFNVFNVLIFLYYFCVLLSLVLYRMSVYLYFHLHFTHLLVLTLVFMVIFNVVHQPVSRSSFLYCL